MISCLKNLFGEFIFMMVIIKMMNMMLYVQMSVKQGKFGGLSLEISLRKYSYSGNVIMLPLVHMHLLLKIIMKMEDKVNLEGFHF